MASFPITFQNASVFMALQTEGAPKLSDLIPRALREIEKAPAERKELTARTVGDIFRLLLNETRRHADVSALIQGMHQVEKLCPAVQLLPPPPPEASPLPVFSVHDETTAWDGATSPGERACASAQILLSHAKLCDSPKWALIESERARQVELVLSSGRDGVSAFAAPGGRAKEVLFQVKGRWYSAPLALNSRKTLHIGSLDQARTNMAQFLQGAKAGDRFS